jgi:hypothetical protein
MLLFRAAVSLGSILSFGVNSTVRDETIIGKETLVGIGRNDHERYGAGKCMAWSKSTQQQEKSSEIKSISHKTGG